MLYNEQQKERYLKQSNMPEESKNVFRMISSTAAKVEANIDLDVANFNRSQVVDLLKSYNSKSRHYLRLICNHYSKYYSWCANEGLVDNSNFINWYDSKLSQPIIKEVLPSELLEDKFFDDDYMKECVEKVKDKQNKLLLYAPYLGIDGVEHEDLSHLRIDDLDEVNKTIQLISGRIAKVDDLFIELIKEANSATRYDKNGTGEVTRGHTEYGDSQYVFKMCGVVENDVLLNSKNMNQRYAIIKEQTGNKLLTIPLIYKNGLMNYIANHFKSKGISLREALMTKRDTKVIYADKETLYVYEKEIQELLQEFGSNMPSRMLRHQMTDIMQFWGD